MNDYLFVMLNRRWKAEYFKLHKPITSLRFVNVRQARWLYPVDQTPNKDFIGFSRCASTVAGRGNDSELIGYLIDNNFMNYYCLCRAATAAGHLSILKRFYQQDTVECFLLYLSAENGQGGTGCSLLYLAAEHGHLEIVKWLREKLVEFQKQLNKNRVDIEWHTIEKVAAIASGRGDIRMLDWILSLDISYLGEAVIRAAIYEGQLDVLKWIIANNYQIYRVTFEEYYSRFLLKQKRVIKRPFGFRAEYCTWAASGGQLDLLQWLREHNCPWDSSVCSSAIDGGKWEIVKWAILHGCPITDKVWAMTIRRGKVKMLQWLHDHHCPFAKNSYCLAIERGMTSVCEWLYEHQYPWEEGLVERAALKKRFGMVKWLIEQKYPFDRASCLVTLDKFSRSTDPSKRAIYMFICQN